MKDISKLKAFLAEPKRIAITTHANPDADALGSSLAFHHFLTSMGHEVYTIVPDSYASFLTWMEGHQEVLVFEENQQKVTGILQKVDLFCALDYSGFKRIKDMEEVAEKLDCPVLLIDHHLDPEIEPDFNFWDNTAAATAELVYDLIVQYDGKESISAAIAECLYAGIMTDTGSFKHPSTTSKIHRIVADLIDLGADVNKVSRSVYDSNTLRRLRFLGFALLKKLVVDAEARVAYFAISEIDIINYDLKKGDTEGLVNYALSIENIRMAAIFIHRDGEIKMSFRSVGDIPVNTFAATYFEGGGHKNAAGGVSRMTLEETEEKFKALINKDVLNTRQK
ncbi:MAG: bifunctional oligoribonuclease/PAP phosphatase NrnA [Bacteroidota bacterium]